MLPQFEVVGWETQFFSTGASHVVSPHALGWAFSQCGGWDTRTNIPKVRESQDKLQYFLTQLLKSPSITSTISTGWSRPWPDSRERNTFPPHCGKNVSHTARRTYRNKRIQRYSHNMESLLCHSEPSDCNNLHPFHVQYTFVSWPKRCHYGIRARLNIQNVII